MKAIWNDEVIADSTDTIVVERHHYFPSDSLNWRVLVASSKTSTCSWKGTANYYSLQVNGKTNEDAAWCYKDPKADAADIKGRVAFWRGVQITD
jgi:uncharacterized protein (DUF427 family)